MFVYMNVIHTFLLLLSHSLYYLTYCKLRQKHYRFTSLGPSEKVTTVLDEAFLGAQGLRIKAF